MAWVFLSRLVKVAPTTTSDAAERREDALHSDSPELVLSRSFPPSPAMCCPLLLLFGVKFGTVLLKQFQEPRIYSDRLELFNFVEVVLCASRLPL